MAQAADSSIVSPNPEAETGTTVEMPFLNNAWYAAGWTDEFGSDAPVARCFLNNPVVFYRKQDNQLVALYDRCPHRWAPLSLGRVEGDFLRCMYHGIVFDAEGKCVAVPNQENISSALCTKTYLVVEKHRMVWIWMGDAALADPMLIPDFSPLDENNRRIYTGFLDYEVNYALVNDNLLDLSHISFLHETSVGRPMVVTDGEAVAPVFTGGATSKSLERGTRVESWIAGSQARYVTLPKNTPNGEMFARTDFVIPGVLMARGTMYPIGSSEASNGSEPSSDLRPIGGFVTFQAVTPISALRTRYFFCVAHYAADLTEEESDFIWDVQKTAFAEDVVMLEAVQERVRFHPARHMAGLAADRGLTLFRGKMSKLIAKEKIGLVETIA